MINFNWKALSLTFICAVFMLLGATDIFAYGTYDTGCSGCHPGFSGGYSDTLHSAHNALTNECTLCHVGAGGTKPVPVSLTPQNAEGTGCAGCHGRLEDAGNDGANAGLGAGLRQVHEGGGVSCTPCHTDTIASYTPVLEAVRPPFYTVLGVNPCNDTLDNDGDGNTDVCDDGIAFGTISGDIQEGVSIIIWSLNCGLTVPVAELTTDQNGFWEYSGLENGRWLLNVESPGYSFLPNDGAGWIDLPLVPIKGYDFISTAD
jgi:hypothetical protein